MAKKQATSQPQSLDDILGGQDSFLAKNKKPIAIGLGAVVVIILAVVAYINLYVNPRNEKANNAIYPCQQYFEASDWKHALNGDSAQCVGFAQVANQYSGTKAGNLATAYAGICLFQMDKIDEAIQMVEKFKACGDNSVSPAVAYNLGELYANKGDVDKGAQMIEEAANQANDRSLTPSFLMEAGKLYYAKQETDKARALFEKVATYKDNPLSAEAEKYMTAIDKAVK